MTGEREKNRTRRVREIYLQVSELTSAGARERALAKTCGKDGELRREVEALLEAEGAAEGFLSTTALGDEVGIVPEQAGQSLGHYRLVERLGEGGFGVVWRAEQTEPVQRQVALKIIKLGMDTKEVIARFQAERQALAMLDHPNIAKVFDAGVTDKGRPYFVMDLIEGEPITEYCDQRNLRVSERLRLFLQLCAGVHHAHSRGIVHRDLKPSNVVVIEEDGKPLVKVIDFGIAKSMQGRLTDKTLYTRREVLLGTPAYMSPEQLNLDADTVDARSDIYSLGVLLYELIAGTPPFEIDTLRRAAFAEVQRILREVEPSKPSTRLGSLGAQRTEIAQRRALEPVALQRLLRGDLDWVVMRALEKDSGRRFATAADLAQDLQRHLRNEPVLAGPPSVAYRAQKYAQRHRVSLAWAAGFAVLLSLWGLSSLRQTRLAQRAADEARETAATAQATASQLSVEERDGEGFRYITGIANVQSEAALSPDETMLAYVDWLPNGDLHVHDLNTGTIRNLTRSNERAPGVYEFCPVYFVWSPDSQWIAYLWFGGAETDASLRVVETHTGEIRVLKPYGSGTTYTPVDWTPDGRHILCEAERRSRTEALVLVSVDTGEDKEVMAVAPPKPEHVRISPDGRYLVYARRQKTGEPTGLRDIHLFELATSQTSLLTTWDGDDSAPIWAPSDSVVLYSSDRLGDVDLWAVRVEQLRSAPPPVAILYGIGDCAKRMTQSGKLVAHRNLKPDKGYSIPRSDLGETMVWVEGELPAGSLDGVVYFTIGGKLHSMSPDGSRKTMLPTNVSGEPSQILHRGQRWFLKVREVPGAAYPSGQSRKELFAVREDGGEDYTVQLTDHPSHEPTDAVRWATDRETGAKDGVVSWCARVWKEGTTNAILVIYTARIAFDTVGNVTGPVEPSKPLVNDAWSHAWSPAGDRLVYETRGELVVLDLATGQRTPFAYGSDPSWSPDGTRIAFHSKAESIQTLTADGAERKTLVARREFEHVANSGTFGKPVWAPDSAQILFHHRAPIDHQGDIFCMPAAGGRPQNLTTDVDYALPIAWRTVAE